jgi:hypothetical protein
MHDMGKNWVVMGRFKLKEWRVYGIPPEDAMVQHTVCGHHFYADDKSMPEILDAISEHECPDES